MAENNNVYGGMYNFKGIMDKFYGYEPGDEDELDGQLSSRWLRI